MVALIKNIFLDILYLYKNFLHWNISKLIIFLWSIILWFLAMVPLVLIIFLYWYFVDLNIKDLSFQVISNSLWVDWIVNILLYFSKFIFVVAYLYGYILLIHFTLEYLKGKKLKYLSNYYWNIWRMRKYISITFFNALVLLIPVVLFIILVFLLALFVWFEDSKNLIIQSSTDGENNYFTIIILILFLASSLILAYLFYRICFVYFIFIEDVRNNQKAIEYIKKSFSLTKSWKSLSRFVLILLILSPFVLVLKFSWGYLENETSTLNNYLIVKDITVEEEEYLKTTAQYTYYQGLILKYSDLSETELKSLSIKNDVFFILFSIFNFILIYGVFTMILASFYKRELLK